jgi:hypothetical protein
LFRACTDEKSNQLQSANVCGRSKPTLPQKKGRRQNCRGSYDRESATYIWPISYNCPERRYI